MEEVQIIRNRVQRDPQGPTTIEDIAVLNTDEWGETYGVLTDGTCVSRRKHFDDHFTPEPGKRNQIFLIDPRTV